MRDCAFPEVPTARGLAMAMEDDLDRTSLTNVDGFREAMKGSRSSHAPAADEPYARMANVGWRVRLRPLDDALRQRIIEGDSGATPVEIVPSTRRPRYSFAGRLERTPDAGGFRYAVERNASDPSVAYVAADPFPVAGGQVIQFRESANAATIDVNASGRAFLVASVTGHRYWSATIDGHPAPLVATNLAFQGLVVPGGAHTIEMRYRNPLIAVGGAVSLLSLIALSAITWFRRHAGESAEETTMTS
jgi:hypothetical protein